MLTLVILRLQYQQRGLTIPKKDYKTHKTRALDHNIASLYLYETCAYVICEYGSPFYNSFSYLKATFPMEICNTRYSIT